MFSDSLGELKYKYCSKSSSKSSFSDDSTSLSDWIEISKNRLSDDEFFESELKEEIFSHKSSANWKSGEPEKISSALPSVPSSAAIEISRKKPFECPICSKHLKKNLRCHIESVHCKIKKWYCNFCFYPFYYKGILACH